MNDRIKQLAYNAGFELNPAHFDHEKFAELIVRECIQEVVGLQVDGWNEHWNRAIAHASLHLKDHFGVVQ